VGTSLLSNLPPHGWNAKKLTFFPLPTSHKRFLSNLEGSSPPPFWPYTSPKSLHPNESSLGILLTREGKENRYFDLSTLDNNQS